MSYESNMMLLRTLLPVVWAIVSTGVGLVLYKTSSAFFEQEDKAEGRSRRIRLVGSVVIAGLAFFALRQSTPTELLIGRSADKVIVSSAALSRLSENVEQAKAAANELNACTGLTDERQCRAQLADLELALDQVSSAHGELQQK